MLDREQQNTGGDANARNESWMAGTGGQRNVPGSFASGLNMLLGLWLCTLGPLFTLISGISPTWGFWNNVLCGALIAFTGFVGLRNPSPIANVVQVVLGGWLLIATMIEGYGHGSIGFNANFAGGLVTFMALIAIIMKSSAGRRRSPGV
jgi:hypothetical protein